jgi:hypothetical protein
MKKTENTLPEGVSPEMIESWKQKHGQGKIKCVTLCPDVPGKTKDVVVCIPSRTVYNQYDKWSASDPGKARDILVNACLLSDAGTVKADDDLFFSCVWALTDLLPLHRAIITDL